MQIKLISFSENKVVSLNAAHGMITDKIEEVTGLNNCEFDYCNTQKDMFEALQDGFKSSLVIVLVVDVSLYISTKAALFKAMGLNCKINGRILSIINSDACIATLNEKQANAHSAIPVGGIPFITSDGLFSGFGLEAGKQKLVMIPIDERRMSGLLESKMLGFITEGISVNKNLDSEEKSVEEIFEEAQVEEAEKIIAEVTPVKEVAEPEVAEDIPEENNAVISEETPDENAYIEPIENEPEDVAEEEPEEEIDEEIDADEDSLPDEFSSDEAAEQAYITTEETSDINAAETEEPDETDEIKEESDEAVEVPEEIIEPEETVEPVEEDEEDNIDESNENYEDIASSSYSDSDASAQNFESDNTPVANPTATNPYENCVRLVRSKNLKVAFAVQNNSLSSACIKSTVNLNDSDCFVIKTVELEEKADEDIRRKEAVASCARKVMTKASSTFGVAMSPVYYGENGGAYVFATVADSRKSSVFKIYALEGESDEQLVRTGMESLFEKLYEIADEAEATSASSVKINSASAPAKGKKGLTTSTKVIIWALILIALCALSALIIDLAMSGKSSSSSAEITNQLYSVVNNFSLNL